MDELFFGSFCGRVFREKCLMPRNSGNVFVFFLLFFFYSLCLLIITSEFKKSWILISVNHAFASLFLQLLPPDGIGVQYRLKNLCYLCYEVPESVLLSTLGDKLISFWGARRAYKGREGSEFFQVPEPI